MAGLISPSPISFLQGGGAGGGGGGGTTQQQQQQQYNLNLGVSQVLPQAYQQHQQQRAVGTIGLGGGLAGGGVGISLPYSDTPPLPTLLSQQQYMNALQGGGLGFGVAGLGSVGLSAGGVGGIAGMNPGHEEGKLFSLVIDLMEPNTRETALLELSKKREQYDDLAMILWHSFGTHFLFLFLRPGVLIGGRGNRNHARVASRDRFRLPFAFAPQLDRSCVQPSLQRSCVVAVCCIPFGDETAIPQWCVFAQ